jgi:hypothetical protein
MKTADENYRAELEKFKKEMNETVKFIHTLEYALDGHTSFENETVGSVLKRYKKTILNDINSSFHALDKSSGGVKVNKQANESK